MSSTRLLLAAVGGGVFPVIPQLTTTVITSAAGDGWTSIGGPRAVTYNGITYIGTDDNSGNIRVRIWDGASVTSSTLHAALESHDLHDAPALLVRDSDHKLVAAYCGHDLNQLYVRVSTTSLDTDPDLSDGWASEQTLDASLGGVLYTYPQLVQLTGEASDPIYLFYRDRPGGLPDTNGILTYSTSTDGGATWSAQTHLIQESGKPVYWAIASNGTDRIDIAVSNGHPILDTPVGIYHAYVAGGNLYKTNGSLVGAISAGPYAPSSLTQVYDASDGEAGISDVFFDGSGNPVLVHGVIPNPTFELRFARWTGSAWTSTTVASGTDPGLFLISTAIDPLNAYRLVTAEPVSGVYELIDYRSPDSGLSWIRTAITSGSADEGVFYPTRVQHPTSDLRVVAVYGAYTDYFTNTLGIVGVGT